MKRWSTFLALFLFFLVFVLWVYAVFSMGYDACSLPLIPMDLLHEAEMLGQQPVFPSPPHGTSH